VDALWPVQAVDIDVTDAIAQETRSRPNGRPWVTMLMISSVDGAAAMDGVSGPLGAPSDKAVFAALRSLTDAVLVGAGTVRVEDYGPIPDRSADIQARRTDRGQAAKPLLAIVSGRMTFDPDARVFENPDEPPLIYTSASAPVAGEKALGAKAVVVRLGSDAVDLEAVLHDLGARGASHVLLEGGPSLNGDLMAAGLVDEIHLSLAPLVAGGDAPRIVAGDAVNEAVVLDRVWTGDGLLFLRYRKS